MCVRLASTRFSGGGRTGPRKSACARERKGRVVGNNCGKKLRGGERKGVVIAKGSSGSEIPEGGRNRGGDYRRHAGNSERTKAR